MFLGQEFFLLLVFLIVLSAFFACTDMTTDCKIVNFLLNRYSKKYLCGFANKECTDGHNPTDG
jgi:hypothetical protein